MTTNDKETHFQGFAKLLWDEIQDCLRERHVHFDVYSGWDETQQAVQQLIAECAYDLVLHTLTDLGIGPNQHSYDPMGFNKPEDIPDLTTWPE